MHVILKTRVVMTVFAVAATVVAACSALPLGQTVPTTPTDVAAGALQAAPTTEPTAVPQMSQPGGASAATACSKLLDNIPDVQVNSGTAELAAAYDVNGAQLATYIEAVHDANGVGGSSSTWRDQPTKPVTMCIYDGDFNTLTPGPPGHDTSASRVLVLIVDGQAELWAITKDRSAMPITDPAPHSN